MSINMQRFKILIQLLLLGISLFSVSAMAKPIVLRTVTFTHSATTSQITFNLSSATHYRMFALHNPNRFIIDLKNVRVVRPLRLKFPSSSPIKNFRYALHSEGIFRIVLGLNAKQLPVTQVITDHVNHTVKLDVIFQNIKKPIKTVEKQEKIHTSVAIPPAFSATEEKSIITEADIENAPHDHRDVIVVIDPGHGGKDPGATGINGTHEKNIVLSISKILQKWINQQRGFHAVLTRTGDYYLTLRQRLAIARKDKADMFIAIHADMFRNNRAQGVSVFALSQRGATSEAARWLATRENASELMGGVDLHDKSHLLKSVLINLSQSATIRSSLEIGADIIHTVSPIARLHHNRVEQAAFVVLKSPDIPSLLVETGFLSNPREEKRLSSISYQTELARALMRGIRTYFDAYPPRDTWLSYWRDHPRAMAKKRTHYES